MYIYHYIVLVKKRFWLILLGILLCVGVTGAITTLKPPVYEAIATIESADAGTDIFGNQAEATALAIQATNADVLKQAANILADTTPARLATEVTAYVLDNTQLIAVQADAPTPQQAMAIANMVAHVFIQQTLAGKTARLQATAKQLATQLAAAKTTLDQTEQQLTRLQQNNAPATQIQQVSDQLANDQSNYDTLSASYTSVLTQEAQVNGSLILEQEATLPTGPSGLSKGVALSIAAALSCLLMVVLVFLLDWLDVTIRTPEDIVQLAHLEPLGSIPARQDGLPAALLQSDDAVDEIAMQAFTVISTHFRALYKGQRALLVTGLHRISGASTVAAHLAVDLAQSGIRVLLVDANLRKPVLHEMFHVVNTRGLTNSLRDIYTLQKQSVEIYSWLQIWTTQVPNLWLLPAGPTFASPTSVLRAPELQNLVRALLEGGSAEVAHSQKLIDLIIFDAPALLEEADATILALLCDSSLLVIEAAKERKETLQKASVSLQRLGAPVSGVVVNRQKASHRSYLHINSSAQDALFGGKSAIEPPARYPRRNPASRKSEFAFPRTLAGGQPTVHEEQAEALPVPHGAARTNVTSSSGRIPQRPFPARHTEESGHHSK